MNRRKTSEHFVSLINLIIFIIINYQLSSERISLVFNSQSSIFFLHGAHVVPEDVMIKKLLHPLPLSQVADCETTRAVGKVYLKRYVHACKK